MSRWGEMLTSSTREQTDKEMLVIRDQERNADIHCLEFQR